MTRNKTAMTANSPDSYIGSDGYTMKREWGLLNGSTQLSGEWVLRDKMKTYVDYDGNRHDLAERNLIVLS